MNTGRIGLILSVAAFLSLCAMSAKGWQVSHSDLAGRLDEIQKQHSMMMVDLSVTDQRLKDIDKRLSDLDGQKLNERLIRMEAASEASLWFLRAILLPLLFLSIERIISLMIRKRAG